jgi:hypothetical protein
MFQLERAAPDPGMRRLRDDLGVVVQQFRGFQDGLSIGRDPAGVDGGAGLGAAFG